MNSQDTQFERRADWDRAFHEMVRGIVYEHLMAKVRPALKPLCETLDKIESGFAEIARIA